MTQRNTRSMDNMTDFEFWSYHVEAIGTPVRHRKHFSLQK